MGYKLEQATDEDESGYGGCVDPTPRNRRADLRMSDIRRAVDKAVPDSPKTIGHSRTDPELLRLLDKAKKDAENITGAASYSMFDKNTPSSLKQLRWEIYDLIESYEGDYGRTVSMTLRSKIEDLFKKYTHS